VKIRDSVFFYILTQPLAEPDELWLSRHLDLVVGAYGTAGVPHSFFFASIVDDGRRLQGMVLIDSPDSPRFIVMGFKYSSKHQGIFENAETTIKWPERFMPIPHEPDTSVLIYFNSWDGLEWFSLVNDEKYTLNLKSQIIEEPTNLIDYFPETSGLNKEIKSLLENPYPMSENFVIGDQFLYSAHNEGSQAYYHGHIIKFNIELVSK
jgi:hypothetical protein